MKELEKRLREETTAELRFDEISCQAWSSDASLFRIKPLGVALPKTQEDLEKIILIASELAVPIIARGAATGISGGCIGKGLIVDVSKYLTSILEINIQQQYAWVEPGVILNDLNEAISSYGYRFGPETSTGNRATLGGMAANNASGARSLRYGKMVDHVLEAEMILPYGKRVLFKELSEKEWEKSFHEESPLARVVRVADSLREYHKEEILLRFPKLDRRVSGYNLDTLLTYRPPNLAKIVVGSEGSLGVISKLKLKLIKKPDMAGLAIIHFHDLNQPFSALHSMLHWDPLALELLDHHILNLARDVPLIKNHLEWLKGDPEAIVIAEFDAHELRELKLKLTTFEADMRNHGIGYAYTLLTNPAEIASVWGVRKAGLGLLMSKRSYTNAVAFLEDIAVPVPELASFMLKFREILASHHKEAGIYGHIGAGCMHIRPYLNMKDSDDVALISTLMHQVSTLILEHAGTLSGEHGDGLIRSWMNEKMFGKNIYKCFKEIKRAFDPDNLMNPGKVVDGLTFDELQKDLKIGPKTETLAFKTFLDFSREGGYALAVDLCNGNGLCRKKEGTMCPSFQATGDEYDTTRARANALQGLIHGTYTNKERARADVNDILKLCLECKGCKSECPSSVDMAKMKSEFLYHYQLENGTPLRARLFTSMPLYFKWGSLFPKLLNKLFSKPWMKKIQSRLGIAQERTLPVLTQERFSKWYEKNIQGKQLKGKRVLLFNDSYNEFVTPEIGKSAVRVLNAMGYEVICPPWKCCGRAHISKGRLKEAKRSARKLIETLAPYAKGKMPIIGLEPSCILTLMDEYRDFPDLNAKDVIDQCCTFDDFVYEHLEGGKLNLPFKKQPFHVKVHGHCHQKALVGMKSTLAVLRGVEGFTVEEIQSGCCGMAGSFGYEKEHYELSLKIGELKLLPQVRLSSKETLIVANGFSCRTQIADGAGRSAMHLAEALERQLL